MQEGSVKLRDREERKGSDWDLEEGMRREADCGEEEGQ